MGKDRIVDQWRGGILAGIVAAGIAGVPQAFAQEAAAPVAEVPEEPGMKVSGNFKLDFNTHFISYGFDVWGGGTSWNDFTINPSGTLNFDLDYFSVVVGTWWDVNSNTTSAIGGQLQEVDVWYGISVPIDAFTLGITYQDWIYASQVEKILDISAAYDDSELWGGDFALNPSVVFHQRLAGDGLEDHFAVVAGIAPGFTLIESETFGVDLTVPVSVGFFEGDFHGGDSGFGFFSVGAQFSTPLSFIPTQYGSWSLNYGLTLYVTDDDVIPNEDDTFVTGNIGVGLSF